MISAQPHSSPTLFRRLLASGQMITGCWCTLPSATIAESEAAAGFASIVIDLQHGAASWDSLVSLIQAVELGGASPIVRVGWNDQAAIMRAFDLGAAGVIIPMVETAQDAARAAAATRYPPDGNRSYGPARRKYASTQEANADLLCLPMIETAEGLRNVDEIAAVGGVDGLFVGPADLALSLGVPLEEAVRLNGNRVTAAMEEVIAAARRHGRFVGTVAASGAHAAELLRRGVQYVTLGSDKAFVANGAAAALRQITTSTSALAGERQPAGNAGRY